MRHIMLFTTLLACLLLVPGVRADAGGASEAEPLTVDSPLGVLMDHPQARDILQQHLPVLFANPQIEQARNLPLRALQAHAPELITDTTLVAIDRELQAAGVQGIVPDTPAPVHPVDSRLPLRLETIPLWEDGAPGALGDRHLDIPTLTVVRPDGAVASRTAVIVAPGGGYQILATGHEGRQVADWFAAHGITAFVLRYRLCSAGYTHPNQLQDARRAVRWVRAHADRYGINPARVGMVGFSAGGHLTAMVSTQHDAGNPDASDPVERQSSRPDFAVLAYAPTSLQGGEVLNCVAGDTPTAQTLQALAPVDRVSGDTPPAFLFHTSDDELVPPWHATRYYDALQQAGVSAELHIHASGRHGQGLALPDAILGTWPSLLMNWLRARGLL